MTGSYGKNREIDFARFANLGGKPNLSDEELQELELLCGYSTSLYDELPDDYDPIPLENLAYEQSEAIYRTSCLLAYGSGLACWMDIERFIRVMEVPDPLDDDTNPCMIKAIEAVLPNPRDAFHLDLPATMRIPGRYGGGLNPSIYHPYIHRAPIKNGGYQVFRMTVGLDDEELHLPEPYRLLGQVIANAYALTSFVGIYDGRPAFEPEYNVDRLWQTLAELAPKQAPGICPVCGKVFDRRRTAKGGKPKKACDSHGAALQNTKRDLKKEAFAVGNHELAFSDKLEEAVRMLRWNKQPELNERPLMFGGAELLGYGTNKEE